jgi:transcriptional regulator with XRE-family HTH domain
MFHSPSPGRAPNPVDVHVGRQLRRLRKAKGLSQAQLADAIGVTFQQVQKYERGANRLSASKLFESGKALDASPTAFFQGLLDDGEPTPPLADPFIDLAHAPDGQTLATEFLRIDCRATRAALVHLVRRLAGGGPDGVSG